MVINTKHEYSNITGYKTNQYCSVNCNFASINLVAETVDQAIANAERIKPNKLLRFNTIAKTARKITGKRQYPKTEQVLQKSKPTGCINETIPWRPRQPKTLKP